MRASLESRRNAFSADEKDVRAMSKRTDEGLREIANMVRDAIGPGLCFALFIGDDGRYHYVSNAERGDVRTAMQEWLAREAMKVNTRALGETSMAARNRLALEDRCVDLVKTMSTSGDPIILFLFEFAGDRNIAWRATSRDTRGVIEAFVEQSNAR